MFYRNFLSLNVLKNRFFFVLLLLLLLSNLLGGFIWIKNAAVLLTCGVLERLEFSCWPIITYFIIIYILSVNFSQAITFIAVSYYLAAVTRKPVEILLACACVA